MDLSAGNTRRQRKQTRGAQHVPTGDPHRFDGIVDVRSPPGVAAQIDDRKIVEILGLVDPPILEHPAQRQRMRDGTCSLKITVFVEATDILPARGSYLRRRQAAVGLTGGAREFR